MMKVYVNRLTHDQAIQASKMYLDHVFQGIDFDLNVSEENENHLVISWRAGPLIKEVNEISARFYNHIPLANDPHNGDYLFNLLCVNGNITPAFKSEHNVEFFTIPFKLWTRWRFVRLFESFRISENLPKAPSIIQMPFTKMIMKRDNRFRKPTVI